MAFAVLTILFAEGYQAFSTGAHSRSTGASLCRLSKSVNNLVVNKIKQFGDLVTCTQRRISATIGDSLINIKYAAECSAKETDNLLKIIDSTKLYNSELFKCQGLEDTVKDLDALSNHIIIAGQKGLVILDRICLSESAVRRLMQEFYSNQNSLIAGVGNTDLCGFASEIKELLNCQKTSNIKVFEEDRNLIEIIKNYIARQALLGNQRQLSIGNIASELLSLSAAITKVAIRLGKISRMFEDNLTILLKMCELSILFQVKSQTFLSSSQDIKSRLNQVVAKIRQDHEPGIVDEQAVLMELETINDLVNELVFDCPI